jgi:eukaryotic-like serine/threonine-protein kinase
MNAALFQHFEAMVDLSLGDRETALKALAESDSEIAEQLRRLFRNDDQYAERAEVDIAAVSQRSLHNKLTQLSVELPQFEFIDLLGEGGMGEVWRVRRKVADTEQVLALKLLRIGQNAAVNARFLREQQIMLQLDHPNIARLFDAGHSDAARPWIAMELIDGVDIVQYCDDRKLSIEQRLRLFLQVLAAIQFSHQRFIVHRDIKPENVMVTQGGLVKVLDFGIAKAIGESAKRTTEQYFSRYGVSPEQITGAEITAMTDVYGLGALLYELLCGQTMVDLDLPSAKVYEHITRQMPKAPSLRIDATASKNRKLVKQGKGYTLHRELDNIVLHTLRKNPQERYSSVGALAADIEAHLANRPVAAVGSSNAYVFKKFVRRHWLPVSIAGAVSIALIAMLGLIVWRGQQLQLANKEANIQRQASEAVNGFLIDAFKRADPLAENGGQRGLSTLIDASYAEFKSKKQLGEAHAPMLLALAEGLVALGKARQAREMLTDLKKNGRLTDRQSIALEFSTGEAYLQEVNRAGLLMSLTRLKEIDAEKLTQPQLRQLALLESHYLNLMGEYEKSLARIADNSPKSILLKVDNLLQLARYTHAEKLLDEWRANNVVSDIDKPVILNARRRIARSLDQREKTLVFARESLLAAERVFGKNHSAVLSYENNVAGAEMRFGNYEAALAKFEGILNSSAEIFDETSARGWIIRFNIALCNAKLGALSDKDLKILQTEADTADGSISSQVAMLALARWAYLNDESVEFKRRMQDLGPNPNPEIVSNDFKFLRAALAGADSVELRNVLSTFEYIDRRLDEKLTATPR